MKALAIEDSIESVKVAVRVRPDQAIPHIDNNVSNSLENCFAA